MNGFANGVRPSRTRRACVTLGAVLTGLSCTETTSPHLPNPPESVTVTVTAARQIEVSWLARPGNETIASYRVFRDDTAIADTPALSLVDSTASQLTTHQYSVASLSSAGTLSQRSAPVSVLAPDATPPRIESFSPNNGTRDVSPNQNIQIRFSERMDPVSITPATLLIVDSASGSRLDGALSYDDSTRTATWRPSSLLPFGDRINVTLTADPQDLSGLHLTTPLSFFFRIASLRLDIAPANPVILAGASLRVEAVLDPRVISVTGPQYWASSNRAVVEIDSTGLITAKDPGSATLILMAGGRTATTTVVVQPAPLGVQAKDRTTCAIAANGDGYCWGSNRFGQAGSGTADSSLSVPTKVAGGLTFLNLSPGAAHTCGTTGGGTFCWGCNSNGELGNGTSAHDQPGAGGTCGTLTLMPAPVSTSQQFSHVEASGSVLASQQDATCSDAICSAQSCALTPAGTLYCWGNLNLLPSAATQAPLFKTLSMHMQNECGISLDSAVFCFSTAWIGGPSGIKPLPVTGGNRMQAVSVGRSHSCSIDQDGRAYCWGSNTSGQLGSPSSETCPQRFGGYPCRTMPDTVFGGHRFQSISAGGGSPATTQNPQRSHTCGVTVSQDVYCWGENAQGELGNGTTTNSPSPVRIASEAKFVSVATGNAYSCALAVSGSVYCWGSDPADVTTVGAKLVPVLTASPVAFR